MTQRKISKELRGAKASVAKMFKEQEDERLYALAILGQQRAEDVQRLYAAGFSFDEIGKLFRMSYEQARQIYLNSIGYLPRFDYVLEEVN